MKSMEMRRAVQATADPARSDVSPQSRRAPAAPTLDSGVLFAGTSEVVIAHAGEFYRLRLTRQNRLILTK